MKKSSALAQQQSVTEGSGGNHQITVKMTGPAVESYSRSDFLRDLRKVSKKQK